jgi:hypothetical protein
MGNVYVRIAAVQSAETATEIAAPDAVGEDLRDQQRHRRGTP